MRDEVTQRDYPPTDEYPLDDWHRVLAVNPDRRLAVPAINTKYELAQMRVQGSGAIVNTASIAGLVGIAGRSAYVASKHGVVGITKTAALEYASQGIRVNAVCPGYVRTPMVDYVIRHQGPELEAQIVAREPVGRLGQPEEIAETVVWLCSDAASFITGHAMAADGGFMAQ